MWSIEIALPSCRSGCSSLHAVVRQDDVYRLKGVLSIDESDERFVLHGVHADVHGHFERPWAPGERRVILDGCYWTQARSRGAHEVV